MEKQNKKDEYLVKGNSSFHIKTCALMTKDGFIAAHKGKVSVDLASTYETIKSLANGNSGATGKKGAETKGKSADAGDIKKPGDKGENNSAEHAKPIIP